MIDHCLCSEKPLHSAEELIEVTIDDQELAIAVLNCLSANYGTIITALDAIEVDGDSFTLDKLRSRLLQHEKRKSLRHG
eukprot:IDg15178t1